MDRMKKKGGKRMKGLKRNQIIILVIALMLVSAGYLNYTANQNDIVQTSTEEESMQYAGIGDAKLVSSNGVIEQNEQETLLEENRIEESNTIVEEKQNEITTTTSSIANKETQEYFSSSRLNRETMYSQMLESYQKILENESIGETQKSIAQTEIQNINRTKNKIMICENLIKTKGIEDLVIFVNDKSISVVVRADELSQEQIAQMQNIIAREMETEISNIHISNK